MATSTPGIGSGLDVNSIVSQLVAVEKQPLLKLQQRATTIQAQISSWGKIKSLIDSLRTATAKLSTSATWTQTQVVSSDPASVAAGLSTTGTPSPGRYAVASSQLAQQHVLNSTAIADGTDLRGRLKIELGTYGSGSPPPFSVRSGSQTIDLDFTDSATTLSNVRDAINAANAGINATVLSDASGSRLVVSSAETGRDRAIRITVSSTTTTTNDVSGSGTSGSTTSTGSAAGGALGSLTGTLSGTVGGLSGGTTTTPTSGGTPTTSTSAPTGLSALAYDGSSSSSMVQAKAAQDANYTINGVALSSPSNVLDDSIRGVRLQLSKVTISPIDIVVQADAAGQRKSLEEFVAAYNAVNAQLSADTAYDASTGKGGVFQGDFSALSIKRRLREMMGQSNTASTIFTRLSDLGMDIKRDGNISLDASKLEKAFNNAAEMAKLLSAAGDGSEQSKGLAVRLKVLTDSIMSADGIIDSKDDALRERMKRNRTDQDQLNARVEATRLRLLRLYQSLDNRVSKLNGLGGYVNQQFGSRG